MADFEKLINSNYTRKYIVDAEQLNRMFAQLIEEGGTNVIKDVIQATGVVYNPLQPEQFMNALTQLIVSANLFKDTSETADIVTLTNYTSTFGVPTSYIHNMGINFYVAQPNTGPVTLGFTGTSPVKLLTDLGEDLTVGSLAINTLYSARYDSVKEAFILASTTADSGAIALQEIRYLIESIGMGFSSSLINQLTAAVSRYALSTSYEDISTDADKTTNNYLVRPFDGLFTVPSYFNGLTFSFRPSYSNNLVNATVQIQGKAKITLYKADGFSLTTNELTPNAEVVVKYMNGSFLLVSNKLSTFMLPSGPTVNRISDDITLAEGSSNSLVTERAVKEFATNLLSSDKSYTVSSGNRNSNNQADLVRVIDNNTLSIIAGERDTASWINLASADNVVASTPKDPIIEEDETITFSAANMFNGDNDSYYETKATGSDVVGTLDTTTGLPINPTFIGAKNLTELIQRITILPQSPDSSPSLAYVQYAVNYVGTDPTTWTWQYVGDVGTRINPDNQQVEKYIIPRQYTIDTSSTSPVSLDLTEFQPYTDATEPESSPLVFPYAIRVIPFQFSGIDRGWATVSLTIDKISDPIEPVIIKYPGNIVESVTSTENIDVTDAVGDCWIIKTFGSNFDVVSKDHYTESAIAPVSPVEGDYWIQILNGAIIPYLYAAVAWDDNNNPTAWDWTLVEVVKVGSFTRTSGVISNVYTLAYNGEYLTDGFALTVSPQTFAHNIGAKSEAEVWLECKVAELGYSVGEVIRLDNYSTNILIGTPNANTTVANTNIAIDPAPTSITPNPHNHTASTTITNGTITNSFSSVSVTPTIATWRYSRLSLPDSSNTLQLITPANWVINLAVTRDF